MISDLISYFLYVTAETLMEETMYFIQNHRKSNTTHNHFFSIRSECIGENVGIRFVFFLFSTKTSLLFSLVG